MESLLGEAFRRGGCDQVLAAQQQAGALRTADALAAGERHQVEAHRRVLPEVLDRRHVGGGVVERRDAVLLAEPRELLVLDLPVASSCVVEEEHHGRLRR